MIVGNGLIAKAINSCDREDVILFASGVSNSVSPRNHDFEREEQLIKHHLNNEKCFVYFSTISINDDSINRNSYIRHKLKMEQLIQQSNSPYLILRLPNIIGEKGNPNTLYPYFKSCLEQNEKVTIKKDAHRYLLTTNQLCKILNQVLLSKQRNAIINCVLYQPYKVVDIYKSIATVLKLKPNFELIDGGMHYEVNANFEFDIQVPALLSDLIEQEVLLPLG
ncbi:polysaccharide biosynthesis protein [Bacteroidia bacterium]|nr:polysaccharide biosynthesis protein [Bacteroidia bacterium]